MANKCFIGGGASTLFSQLFHWTEGDFCLYGDYSLAKQGRRKNLEINKLFSEKAQSRTTIQFDLQRSQLHDRLVRGGNSNIWGGFIRIYEKSDLEFLTNKNIYPIKLGFDKTGCISNNDNIFQLQNSAGRILDSSQYLKSGISSYVTEIHNLDGHPVVNFLKSDSSGNIQEISKKFDFVFLSIGVIQLIDLLFRSNIIKDGDILTLQENPCSFKLVTNTNLSDYDDQDCIIRYSMSRAILHLLGYQKKVFPSQDHAPFIDQIFHKEKNYLNLKINQSIITELTSKNTGNFGKSIHYNNLKINGTPVQTFINNKIPNVIVLGMASVEQTYPGPISNDIYYQAKQI